MCYIPVAGTSVAGAVAREFASFITSLPEHDRGDCHLAELRNMLTDPADPTALLIDDSVYRSSSSQAYRCVAEGLQASFYSRRYTSLHILHTRLPLRPFCRHLCHLYDLLLHPLPLMKVHRTRHTHNTLLTQTASSTDNHITNTLQACHMTLTPRPLCPVYLLTQHATHVPMHAHAPLHWPVCLLLLGEASWLPTHTSTLPP